MAYNKVLIIEPDAGRAAYLKTVLEFVEHKPVVDSGGGDYLQQLEDADELLAAVVGEQTRAGDQRAIVDSIHKHAPHVPVLVTAGKSGRGLARELEGAEVLDVVAIPSNYTALVDTLNKAQIFRESKSARREKRPVDLFRSLVGNSRGIQKVRKLIEQVADSEANVLILGQSGTGKEVVARNLHYHSTRRDKPFVPVNCGAIPPDLLESELFGHEKGAFTGAISARQGRFEMAEKGTLFLDEIGDMSMPMQVKLLRVLQERTFERVGSNKTLTCNVRIIAATHRNLEEAIVQGGFREDLFYRLNVFPIDMPPLCERVEDVPLLVNELITRIEHEKRGSVRLTPAAVMALCQYRWPGNVRELANLIERLAILHPYGVVDTADMPEKFRPLGTPNVVNLPTIPEEPVTLAELNTHPRLPRDGIDLKEHLCHLEYNLIKQALDESDGVVAHAARRLHMRRTTLVEKLRKYGLQRTDEAAGI